MFKLWISLALAAGACAGGTRTCAAQQLQRVVLWEKPPTIAVYSPTLEILSSDIPGEASSDWPSFTSAVVAELGACTRLSTEMLPGDWRLWTVDAPLFYVIVGNTESNKWETGGDYIGFTFPLHKRIYVAQAGLQSRRLIKHELLHALLAAHGFDARHNTPVSDGMFRRCKLTND